MKNNISNKLAKVKDAVAEQVLDEELQGFEAKRAASAWMTIGAIHSTRKLRESMSAQIVRALAEFGDSELYKSLGFATFAEFLDNSEYSPMSKSRFYERKQLLDAEGVETFDLLSAIGLPVRKRQMLGRGSVEVNGDLAIIKDGDTETTIDIKDKSRLLETLSALADANAEKTKKLEKGQADYKKLKERVRDLEDSPAAGGGKLSQGEQLAGTALNSFAGLCAWAETAPIVEVSEFLQRDLALFATQYRRLFEIIDKKGLGREAWETANSDEENRLAALLDEDDE